MYYFSVIRYIREVFSTRPDLVNALQYPQTRANPPHGNIGIFNNIINILHQYKIWLLLYSWCARCKKLEKFTPVATTVEFGTCCEFRWFGCLQKTVIWLMASFFDLLELPTTYATQNGKHLLVCTISRTQWPDRHECFICPTCGRTNRIIWR